MKEIRVILSPEAKEVYKKLNQDSESSKQSRMLLKAINQKIDLIKQNVKNLTIFEHPENFS